MEEEVDGYIGYRISGCTDRDVSGRRSDQGVAIGARGLAACVGIVRIVMAQVPPNAYRGSTVVGVRADKDAKFVGEATGELMWVAELGMDVRTFEEQWDERWVDYHIPPSKRGHYQPEDLANYDPKLEYRLDPRGYVSCGGTTKAGLACARRAVNMTGCCEAHGGRLHPLDKIVYGETNITGIKSDVLKANPPEHLTRWEQLCQGLISVEELDDEEIQRAQCRDSKGGFNGNVPKIIPRAIHDKMIRELFVRMDKALRTSLPDVVETMTGIATGDAYEPADRINASKWVWEKVRGKTPDVVVMATEPAAWEQVFEKMSSGSRAESRARRGIASEDDDIEVNPESVVYEAEAETMDLANSVEVHLPPEEEPIYDAPLAAGPWVVPPADPLDRQEYERLREKERKDKAAALKERITKARSRRYAARANGMETIASVPFVVQLTPHGEGMRLRFIAPEDVKVPASVKAKETRRRKQERQGFE